MMPDRNKKLERLYFDSFHPKVNDFPTGTVIHDDAPDFLISTPQLSLGVEITQIFREAPPGKRPEQQYEAEEQLIVDRAQELAMERHLPPLLLTAHFSSQRRPQKRKRDSIVKLLVESVSTNVPTVDDFALVLQPKHGLPGEIDTVWVRRYPCITKPLWQPGRGGPVMEDCASDLQTKIDSKDIKIVQYRKRCSDCWLLIVADWFAASSAFYEPSETTLSHKFTTAFDRVYFLERFSGRVLRLCTVANAA